MKITYIGHSCFKIEKNGYAIVTDPYGPDSVPGLKNVSVTANKVLCSHGHFDHSYAAGVSLKNSAAAGPEITEIESWHDDAQGTKRGANKIRIMDFDGEKIAHMGDIGTELTDEQLAMLQGVDVLLIPVGGFYTIDGKQAAQMTQQIKPRIVIPMHFRDDQAHFGYGEISTVDDFTGAVHSEMIRTFTSVNTTGIRSRLGDTLVVVMRPQNVK